MDQLFELFPTPFMHCEKLLDERLIDELKRDFVTQANTANSHSMGLVHSQMRRPQSHTLLARTSALIQPKLVEFGSHLFGDRLDWDVKEMWINILEKHGRQTIHNHANCFISGVIYLTYSHPSANTVFSKSLGGRDFVFSNAGRATTLGPFNADKWMAPDAAPGDMLLFPSYLLHEVPPNQGEQRISLAFNAIPSRLDSWGYSVGLSA